MRNKKEVSISLGSIIVVLLIAVLIGLIIYAYKTINEIKNDSAKNPEIHAANENILKDGESVELNQENNEVKELIKKIDFPTYAVASIYKTKGFDVDTIENDLILRLAWSKLEKELVENNVDNIGEYKQTATKENLENSITEIFGKNIEYTDETFTNIDVPTFYGNEANQGNVKYYNNTYTSNYIESEGGDVPFIHQQIEKVLKYNDRIEVYVKTAFIDTEYDEVSNEYDYIIYKDFKNNEFNKKITQMNSLKFLDAYSDQENKLECFRENSQIEKISDKLDTYVYTFILDEVDKNYYLNEFNKAE